MNLIRRLKVIRPKENTRSQDGDRPIESMGSCYENTGDFSSTKVDEKFKLLHFQVPLEFRDPFIPSGYRRPQISAVDCVLSIFKRSNETINVWTMFAALGLLVFRVIVVFSSHNPAEDSFVYPLLSFAIGTSFSFAMSLGAHMFNSMSSKTRHVCFFFDYAGISVYAFSGAQATYFYSRALETDWILLNSYCAFVSLCAAVSILSTYLCCASRHRWMHLKFLVRTGTFALSFFINTSQYWFRMWQCSSELDCNEVSIPYFKRHICLYLVAALLNGTKLPERLMPGVFDFFGQSHHFLHILCSTGAIDEFTALYLDMVGRRKAMEKLCSVPSLENSLCVTLVVLAGNVAVVLWFMCSIKSNETEGKTRGKAN